MATVRIPAEQRTLTDQAEVTAYLAKLGIDYKRWPLAQRAAANAPPDAVLAAYAPEIEQLKARGGYVTADVIDVTPATPNLERDDRPVSRARGRSGGSDSRAARHVALVRPVRRSRHSRDSPVPGQGRMDAALHEQRDG